MLGAVIIVVVLVVAIPVGMLMSGAVAAGVLGFFLKDTVEHDHEGSELVDLNAEPDVAHQRVAARTTV